MISSLTFSSGCDFKLICLTPLGEKFAKNEQKIREYWVTPTTKDDFTESFIDSVKSLTSV